MQNLPHPAPCRLLGHHRCLPGAALHRLTRFN
jgi:hypothetical protein